MIICASCGTAEAEGNGIKLKRCTACYLVRYCSVKCQRDHRPKHKRECKKRAAELKDEILFKQPESSCYGDCPICCLPLSIDISRSTLTSCCSKLVCNGCELANKMQEHEGRLQQRCPFCREPLPNTKEKIIEQRMKRIDANDPVALCRMGLERYREEDYKAAFECWSRAATLGDVQAHYHLSIMYGEGKGVEKNEQKDLYHLTEAAISGHPAARHNLGWCEDKNGRLDRAAKHWTIAAKLGDDESLAAVKDLYRDELVSKDDFDAALRGHKAAIEATKSPQREQAAAFKKRFSERGREF